MPGVPARLSAPDPADRPAPARGRRDRPGRRGFRRAHLKALLDELGRRDTLTLLLLDEVQALATSPKHAPFIAALRTGLDLNKDRVKAVFTGSSREGLRRMFSQASAPFFHFGQNLDFPDMDRGFTEHLAAGSTRRRCGPPSSGWARCRRWRARWWNGWR